MFFAWASLGRGEGTLFANVAPENTIYTKGLPLNRGTWGYVFSNFSIDILLSHAALHQLGILALGPLVQLFSRRILGKLGIIGE